MSVFLFALTVLVRLAFHHYTEFIADDAFITFRYAHNLAFGNGFVYNLGERVMGTTTPLFTFLVGLFGSLGLDIPRAALVMGLFASGLTSIVIYQLANLLRMTHWAALPAVLYALWPRSVVADSCGMEAPLFSLFVIGAVYFHTRRLPIYALAMATLATVTRPEGFALLILLTGYYLFHHRERWIQLLITPLFLLIPWLVFATIYFGSPIPNSVSGKLALYSRWGTMSWWDTLVYYLAWHNPAGWIITFMAIAGGYWLWRKQDWGGVAVIWLAGMIAFYVFSGARVFFWYPAPLYPLLLIFAAATFPYLAGRYPALEQYGRKYAWAVVLCVAVISAVGIYPAARYYRAFQTAMTDCHLSVATFLKENVGPTELVAAEDIGYMGYYSGKRILDRDGLISPEAAPYNRSGDYGGLIRDFKPGWLVAAPDMPTTGFLNDSSFLAMYQEVQEYSGVGCRYTIFKRSKH